MKTYLDSSAVVKLYVTEAKSSEVSQYVHTLKHPLPFSHLHDLELRNGLRLKVFREEVSPESVAASLRLLDEDLTAGVLLRPEFNWFDIFHRAEELSKTHSQTVGCRSLDLLHVASALLLESQDFLTFDNRQIALAKAAGLKIIDLTRIPQA